MAAHERRNVSETLDEARRDEETQHDTREDATEHDEETPLLSRESRDPPDHDEEALHNEPGSQTSSNRFSLLRRWRNLSSNKSSILRRWPSLLALGVLCVVVVLILVGGFFAPEIAQEYAKEAATFEADRLSIDSITDNGVLARIEGRFWIDASKVKRKSVRDLGRFGSYIIGWVESGNSEVVISLPEYGNLVLGTAEVPPIKVNIRNEYTTVLDFLVNAEPGPKSGLRQIANDWIDGRLGSIRVQGMAQVPVKSGIFSFGTQTVSQFLAFDGDDFPTIPNYKIRRLSFDDINEPHGQGGLAAKAALRVENPLPIDVKIPPLGFNILVDGCNPTDPRIKLADANTSAFEVEPKRDIDFGVTGLVRHLPNAFLSACPGTSRSPLDNFVGNYISGGDTELYVQGAESPSPETPRWVTELLYGVTVPVSAPGHALGGLIKNFTMDHVRFSLPDLFAEPGSPDAQPKVSADVKALIALPEEMNFDISVGRLRSMADIFYKGRELGKLDLHKWHEARSRKVTTGNSSHPDLQVVSSISKAPMNITDGDVFEEVIQALLTGREELKLLVKAEVDVEVETALGEVTVRKIPAEGVVPVKPFGSKGLSSFDPQIGGLTINNSTEDSLTLGALVNLTNPTNYSAEIPKAFARVLVNDTVLALAVLENLSIEPGPNVNLPVSLEWMPSMVNGSLGSAVGREFLSQYLSGYNTSFTVKTFEGTIPSQPLLGQALSQLSVTIPTPSLGGSKNGTHFVTDATLHLLTSTADFTLHSPLKQSSLFVTNLNATAFYHELQVGRISTDGKELEVPPGVSRTPLLPVEWSLEDVGYDIVKKALGGLLKLNAEATMDVRLDQFKEHLWFQGRGIGASIRP